MRQWFRLDRLGLGVYLATSAWSCRPSLPSLVPEQAQSVPADSVRAWVAATSPIEGSLHRFKWLFQEERSSTGGRGSVRVAAPDSLRFDVAGPLGAGKSSAVVIGDSALWVVPEKSVEGLVPAYPLLWAMIGIARMPSDSPAIRGFSDGKQIAWQYVLGGDTVEYRRTSGAAPRFEALVRHGGKTIGRTVVTLSPEGRPLKARLTVPRPPAKLDLTFYSSIPTAHFPAETWVAPRP